MRFDFPGWLGLQFGMPRAPNRFQTRRDRDAMVELLCFQQTIVRGIEIITFDVETRQRQAVARSFLRMFVRRRDFAQALTQKDRARVVLQGGLQAFQGASGRAVLDE